MVDRAALRKNLKILGHVQERTGCRILLALKGFAMFSVFPLLRKTLHGVCASSPHEARLGREEFQREVHTFAAAYSREDMETLLRFSDVIVFNSFSQWRRFKPVVEAAQRPLRCGIRVNPEHSEGKVPIYDPCAPGSRLGVLRRNFEGDALDGISGLHFHTLCEHNADALVRTLAAFEKKFGEFLPAMKWVNFGGGHHITRADYDVDLLCHSILDFKKPVSAAGLSGTGRGGCPECRYSGGFGPGYRSKRPSHRHPGHQRAHPYAGCVGDALPAGYCRRGIAREKPYTYRLGGISCLAGDVVGEYSFDEPLQVGQKIVFLDMAHYSMVKTTTFNGVQLPSIALYDGDTDEFELIREFGYDDYRGRLS